MQAAPVAPRPVAPKPAAPVVPPAAAAIAATPATPLPPAPAANQTVDEYHAEIEGWQHTALGSLRALLHRAAPGATESIKWGQPVYEDNGPFAYVRAATDHLTFGFWRGTELPDPAGLLEGAGGKMRHVKLRSTELPVEALEAMVRSAVSLNRAKGDPTRTN